MSNLIFYFTNFKKDIKILYIRINPVKEFTIKMFFYFCLSFIFFILISVNMTFFCQFLQPIYVQKNTCQFLFFYFLRFCVVALFFLYKMFLIKVLLLIVFFTIKLIWLDLKSDLNLIVSGFDNLVCIIIEIAITSLTFIDFLLPLINLDLSILYFISCCFVGSLIFSILYFLLISLSINS